MADLIFTVGYDIAEHDPAGWNTGVDTVIVHIDSEPAEVYEAYNPHLELVCDPSTALEQFTERMNESGTQFDETWYRDLGDHIIDDVATDPPEEDPFTVRTVLSVLRDVMDDDDILISDVGSHKLQIAQNFLTYEPNTCLISNGLASMGISVPGDRGGSRDRRSSRCGDWRWRVSDERCRDRDRDTSWVWVYYPPLYRRRLRAYFREAAGSSR